jgi:hypothetical protein
MQKTSNNSETSDRGAYKRIDDSKHSAEEQLNINVRYNGEMQSGGGGIVKLLNINSVVSSFSYHRKTGFPQPRSCHLFLCYFMICSKMQKEAALSKLWHGNSEGAHSRYYRGMPSFVECYRNTAIKQATSRSYAKSTYTAFREYQRARRKGGMPVGAIITKHSQGGND